MFCLGCSVALPAQIRLDPGVVIDGKVVVRVYVTLHDDQTPYYPVGGLQLRFVRSPRDTVNATTDDAGTATTLLSPGEYRLLSAREVIWKGNRYSWSLPVSVKAGMPTIDLTETSGAPPNVSRASVPKAAPTTTPASPPSSQTRPRTPPPPRTTLPGYKDPATAAFLSLLAAGTGEIYAGETTTGASLLVINALGWSIFIAAAGRSACLGETNCRDATGQELAGLAVVVGSSLYSIFDAPAAARRHNAKLALAVASMRIAPIIAVGGRSGARIGLSLR
jgi:hypothetical protein